MKIRHQFQTGISNLTEYLRETSLCILLLLMAFNLSATTIVDSDYCDAKGTYPWHEWIENIRFSTNDQSYDYFNHSSSKEGYADFTDQVMTLFKEPEHVNISYGLEVTVNYSWDTYDEFVIAWIDFDQNGIFEDDEKIISKGITAPATPATRISIFENFYVPSNALSGPTRLRIAVQRGENETDPCQVFTYGEVEDYTVVIDEAPGVACSGDIILTTQAEVNDFTPCSAWFGDITIKGSEINSLLPLSNLRRIEGDLTIEETTELNNLRGLHNLFEIESILLYNNSGLVNMEGFEELRNVNNDFVILQHPNLEALTGLTELKDVSNFGIEYNPKLTGIEGLTNLIRVRENLEIRNNLVLTNLDGFKNLTEIGNKLIIEDNPLLKNCCGVSDLIDVTTNEILNNLIGCNSEEEIIANCSAIDCTGDLVLTTQAEVDAFPDCSLWTGNITIEGDQITDLSSLSSLTTIEGNLTIEDATALTSLMGLNNLVEVTGNFVLANNGGLTTLEGLDNLKYVRAYFVIENHSNLQSTKGIQNLVYVDDFVVMSNPALTVINDNGKLRVWNRIEIDSNDNLVQIRSFLSLISTKEIELQVNPKLTDLNFLNASSEPDLRLFLNANGFENLDFLYGKSKLGSVTIINNPNLKNLDGLITLTEVQSIKIENNNILTECCGLVTLLRTEGVGDNVTISSNPSGCNSIQEILDACPEIICSGNIVLSSQAEVDAFDPCVFWEGSITISGEDITDLSPLHQLKLVTSNVTIRENESLTNLEGLNSLQEIKEDLRIDDNPSLINLSGLNNLETVLALEDDPNSGFFIRNNNSLQSLDGLESLKRVRNLFSISNNSSLNSCCLLVDEEIRIDDIIIENNLTGCNGLEEVIDFCNEPSEPTDYCNATSDRPWQEWIANVSFAGIDNASGKCNGGICGYSDFTALSGAIIPGSHLPIGLILGKSWFDHPADLYWRVWIDYNGDGDFEDADELVFEKFGANQAVFGSIDIPDNVPLGTTRMRVAAKKGAYADSCENFEKGEVEDYTIQILNDIDKSQVEQVDLYFNALKNGRTTLLNWTRTNELDNEYFDLERSFDGANYEIIHTVDRTTEIATTYRFTDNNPQAGINYYRIKSVFVDGQITYSNVQTVSFEKEIVDIIVFPNPATVELFLDLKSLETPTADLQIYNQLGQPMEALQLTDFGAELVRINLKDYLSGVYHLVIQVDGQKLITRRFVVSKL